MSRFGSCNSTTKNKLLHQYCTALYGSQLWDLASQHVKTLCTKWRIAHRKALSLPYTTHCDLLPLIAENKPLDCILDCRYMAFYKTISESDNSIVKYIANSRLYEYTSTMGRNMLYLTSKYDISIDDIKSLPKTHINRHCYTKW